MIAMIIWGHFSNKNGHVYKFAFPLLILYILLLPFYCLAFIVYIFFFLFAEKSNQVLSYLKMFLNLPTIFYSLKGLSVDVKNQNQDMKIYIR